MWEACLDFIVLDLVYVIAPLVSRSETVLILRTTPVHISVRSISIALVHMIAAAAAAASVEAKYTGTVIVVRRSSSIFSAK